MKYIVAIFLCVLHSVSFAQTAFTRQVWINEPDVPVNVVDVVQQPNSYLWLCTGNGIYRYNGKAFTRIRDTTTANSTAICASEEVVYVGYDNGHIAKVDEQETAPVAFKNGKINSSITALRLVLHNVLLIATEGDGLYISINGTLLPVTSKNGLSDDFISDLALARNKLLLTTDNGFNILSSKNGQVTVSTYNVQDGLPDIITTCIAASADASTFWIGTQKSDVFIYEDRTGKVISLKPNVPWNFGQVNDILAMSADHAWAITDNDFLLELKRKGDSIYITSKLMPVKLKRMVKDKTNNLWCATSKGLFMSTALYASSIPLPSSYKLNSYTAMTCDAKGTLWFTQDNKLFSLHPGKDTLPTFAISVPRDITCLHFSDDQNLWIGTFGRGLYHYSKGGKIKRIALSNSADEHILSITHKGKELWVASFNGIDVLSINGAPVVTNHYNKRNGIGSDYIYRLHTDTAQRIWMATDGGGIVMYEKGRFQKWNDKNGLNSNVFYCITTDNSGEAWGSSMDKGIYHFNGDRWNRYTQQQGLLANNVTALAANGAGGMVLVNRNGIDQWHARDFQFRHFNRRLGIGIDSVSKVLNCVAGDKDGNVYVPYQNGIVLFHPQRNVSIRPDVRIRKQSLFFKELPRLKGHFSHDENHISFTYDGISFSNADRLHFRYKLEGYDNTWVYTNDEKVPFAQLNPGAYTFRIQASLSNNFVNAAEDRFSFHIAKPFWQTPWFVITSALLILFIIYQVVKQRERSIEKLNQLQRERLIYEYEHLKSQVNPHFLFNSFNTLVNIIEEDQDAAIDYTVHLSDLYRSMLSYKDKDLIPLAEEYKIVRSYMHIQKSRFRDALILHENIADTVLKEKKIVPLALQILLENAVKHNIVSPSKPLHIYISASETEIIVRNNLQEKITKDKHTGIGIENIRRRYQLLTSRGISYGIKNNEYIVRLPLL